MSIQSTRRGMLGAMAVAPMVIAAPAMAAAPLSDDAFERALSAYRKASHAERNYPAMKAANELYDRVTGPIFDKWRSADRIPDELPEKALVKKHHELVSEAEQIHYEQFGRPRFEAYEKLMSTPARTIQRVLEKIDAATDEGEVEIEIDRIRDDLRLIACIR